MDATLIVATPETKRHLHRQHAAGRVTRLRRGFYADATDAGNLASLAAAASRLDAVASHETAAALWGIPVLGRARTMHLTRLRRCQGTARYEGVTIHHAGLDPGQVTVREGVPVTTPDRTVMDIARNRPFRNGVVAADAALRQRCCSHEGLRAVAAACRGWPGIARGRRVAAFADPMAASPLESISRVAFHEYGLPSPVLQALIGGYDLADFLWAEYRVIGEADGLGKYTSPEVLRREKLREEGFAQLGFTVFRWTWDDAFRRPDALAHRGLQVLTRCGYRP